MLQKNIGGTIAPTELYPNEASFPAEGVIGSLYLDESTAKVYGWDGVQYYLVADESTEVSEYANLAALPITGVSGILYLTIDTKKLYRWTGAAYEEVSVGGAVFDPNAVETFTNKTISLANNTITGVTGNRLLGKIGANGIVQAIPLRVNHLQFGNANELELVGQVPWVYEEINQKFTTIGGITLNSFSIVENGYVLSDANNAYFISSGTINKYVKATGVSSPLVFSVSGGLLTGFVQDTNNVYYGASGGGILKAPKDGSSTTTIGTGTPQYIAQNSTHVFWQNISDTSKMYRALKDGTGVTAINNNAIYDITPDENFIYYRDNTQSNWLYKSNLDGSNPTLMSTTVYNIYGQDANNLYCFDNNDLKVYKVPKDGSPRTQMGTVNINNSYSIAVGTSHIYVIKTGTKEIYKIDIATGLTETQVGTLTADTRISISGTELAFSSGTPAKGKIYDTANPQGYAMPDSEGIKISGKIPFGMDHFFLRGQFSKPIYTDIKIEGSATEMGESLILAEGGNTDVAFGTFTDNGSTVDFTTIFAINDYIRIFNTGTGLEQVGQISSLTSNTISYNHVSGNDIIFPPNTGYGLKKVLTGTPVTIYDSTNEATYGTLNTMERRDTTTIFGSIPDNIWLKTTISSIDNTKTPKIGTIEFYS